MNEKLSKLRRHEPGADNSHFVDGLAFDLRRDFLFFGIAVDQIEGVDGCLALTGSDEVAKGLVFFFKTRFNVPVTGPGNELQRPVGGRRSTMDASLDEGFRLLDQALDSRHSAQEEYAPPRPFRR